MSNQLFECGICGKLTQLIRRSEQLNNGIVREFAECEKCKRKTTIFYSDKTIRNLLIKQQHTKPGKYKTKLSIEIQNRMNDLQREME